MEKRPRRSSAAAGFEVGKSPPPERPRVRTACVFCRQTKVRCDGNLPCSRCVIILEDWGRGLVCGEKLLPCRPYEPKQQERRGRQGRRSPAPGAADDAQQSDEGLIPPPLQLPFVDMVLSRANMKAEAELVIRCFHRLHEDGRILRSRIITQLRWWRLTALICGADHTYGIADAMCSILQISPVELEGLDAARLERNPAAMRAWAESVMAGLREEAKRLRQIPDFRKFDDGVVPLYAQVAKDQGVVQVVNEAFKDHVIAGAHLYDEGVQRCTISLLLCASFLVPQDREVYYTKWIEMICTYSTQESIIVKSFTPEGELRLFLLKGRRVDIEGNEAVLLFSQPVPNSRHITAQPHIPFAVIKKYRHYAEQEQQVEQGEHQQHQQQPQQEQQTSASSATAAAAAAAPEPTDSRPGFPSLATFPLPLPPGTDVEQLCGDRQRIIQLFPTPGKGSVAARPPAEGWPAPPPLEVGDRGDALPPSLLATLPMPSAGATMPLSAGTIAEAFGGGSALPSMLLRDSLPTPSAGASMPGLCSPTFDVPVLDEAMLNELMEKLK